MVWKSENHAQVREGHQGREEWEITHPPAARPVLARMTAITMRRQAMRFMLSAVLLALTHLREIAGT